MIPISHIWYLLLDYLVLSVQCSIIYANPCLKLDYASLIIKIIECELELESNYLIKNNKVIRVNLTERFSDFNQRLSLIDENAHFS